MTAANHARRTGAPGGPICAGCDRRRGNTIGVCSGCGERAPLRRDRCDAKAITLIAPARDRAHVRAYAIWQVADQLARTSQRGRPTAAAQKYARSLVSEAIKITCWLLGQQLELRDLRQDLLDTWIAGGSGIRRRVRQFITWLARAQIIGALNVEWLFDFPEQPALQDEQRLALLRRLLGDSDIGARERFVGSVLLLYAQPLTRIAQLRTSDITITDSAETAITLARGALVLPEPLASIALALRYRRVADGEHDGWLLPGRKPGTHVTAEHLRKRLAPYCITSRPGRQGALLALAGRLPAPILAERLGVHQARAAQWVRAAGATYADYVALRHS